jgi:hypothetical protein
MKKLTPKTSAVPAVTAASRAAIYAEVERIHEEIDTAFHNWRLQDISVGNTRPTIEDLINEIEICLHPIEVIKQTLLPE